MSDDRDRDFSAELDIAAHRDVVWQALASDAGLRGWFAPEASIEPRVGGQVVWDWGSHHRWVQRIEVVEPGTRLRTRYDSQVDDGDGGKRPLFVDFLLEGDGGTTTLRVVQSGFGPEAAFDDEYDGISRGWPVELQSLRLYAERHAGRPRTLAWASCSIDTPAAEAWSMLTGDGGFRCGTAIERSAPGDAFRFEDAQGNVVEGTALHCHAREFSGIAESHGGAFFRISCDSWAEQTHPWCWLGSWDHPAEAVERLGTSWVDMLRGVFPSPAPTSATDAASTAAGGR